MGEFDEIPNSPAPVGMTAVRMQVTPIPAGTRLLEDQHRRLVWRLDRLERKMNVQSEV